MPTFAEQESINTKWGPNAILKTPQSVVQAQWRMVEKYYPASAITGLTTTASPVTAFNVTGTVEVKLIGVGNTITSTSNNGTLAVGISGATTVLLGTTTVDGTNFPAGERVWIDTSPTLLGEVAVAANLTGLYTTSNIIITIATNNITGGTLRLMCQWRPWSQDGNVVAA